MAKGAVSFIIAALCALAAPVTGMAAEAKALFGAGLSIDGMTFAPFAFSSNWGGYAAMGTAEAARSDESGKGGTASAAFIDSGLAL